MQKKIRTNHNNHWTKAIGVSFTFKNVRLLLTTLSILTSIPVSSQTPVYLWDSIKSATTPVVAPAFLDEYEPPFKQPLSEFGWEDGVHISRDGLHLYALYYPGDLLSWNTLFLDNIETSTFCELFADTTFIRPYAHQYGMDMITNPFGCDQFLNIDILYANRSSIEDDFLNWQLSNMARPGAVEGGAYPLFNEDETLLDIILFTSNSDIWMIRNTTLNPASIETATRLPTPINPDTNEFNADNPHLERIQGDTLLLLYEKYTSGDERDFMYVFSYDDGLNWEDPVQIESINFNMGKIEHPHLYQESNGSWFLYYSLDCDIYRSQQQIADDWDSWSLPELVIEKGNALCIGEPSLTQHGDISFAVVYPPLTFNQDSTDTYEIDPWLLSKSETVSISEIQRENERVSIFPNPVEETLFIESDHLIQKVAVTDNSGRVILEKEVSNRKLSLPITYLARGTYIVRVFTGNTSSSKLLLKR